MTDHLNGNRNIFDAGHPDLIDDHWDAVCHHGHTVMFDESNPFTFLLGESVRSIPSALIPEPSTAAWEDAGFSIVSTLKKGTTRHSRTDLANKFRR
jgi:hypothetical protein